MATGDDVRYLVVLDNWDHIYGLSHGLLAHGWRASVLRAAPLGGYQVFQLLPPAEAEASAAGAAPTPR